MRVPYLTAAAAAALAALTASPLAQATTMVFTYKGHIVQSHDQTGEFGPIGTDTIVGKAYTAKFYVDFDKPGLQHYATGFYDALYGHDADSPVTGVLTLNGRTLVVGGSTPGAYGSDERHDYALDPSCTAGCQTALFYTSAENQTYDFADGLGAYVGHFLSGAEISHDGTLSGLAHDPKNYTNPPVDITNFIHIYEYVDDYNAVGDVVGQSLDFQRTVLHDATIFGQADFVSTGTVPEPAAWALMIAGFGLAGASLRARRRGLA